MENISTDPHAIGAEKGRQLYHSMQIVGLEDTAWMVNYISTAMLMACLGSAKGERERGNERFGTEEELELWFEGMVGYLVGKQMRELQVEMGFRYSGTERMGGLRSWTRRATNPSLLSLNRPGEPTKLDKTFQKTSN